MDDTPLSTDDTGASDDVLMPGLDLPSTAPDPGYQVLARKYRPSKFEDLIGQEPMVRTLTNAFAAGRIAHAYMLTGVRGIGKTTTARLIARALNYANDEVDGPSMDLHFPGVHCEAIARSAHVDVMEMDAASRTGVGDIREILEGVRYAPVSARYKVYIIDEVHMLSTSASDGDRHDIRIIASENGGIAGTISRGIGRADTVDPEVDIAGDARQEAVAVQIGIGVAGQLGPVHVQAIGARMAHFIGDLVLIAAIGARAEQVATIGRADRAGETVRRVTGVGR